MIFTQFNAHIKVFHSDAGGEFLSKTLKKHFQEKGTNISLYVPILHSRQVLLSEDIDQLLKLGLLSFFTQNYQPFIVTIVFNLLFTC